MDLRVYLGGWVGVPIGTRLSLHMLQGMPNQKDLPKDYPLEEVKALYKKSKDLYKAALDDKGACAMIDAAALKKFEEITFGEIYTNLFIGGSGVERIKKLKKSKTM